MEPAKAYPPCFGAAARNPAHRCENPALKLTVSPTPSEALIMPNAPCTPIAANPEVCAFGTSPAAAGDTVALVGDSHAAHWRGAIEVIAQALHWQVFSITRPSCPFTAGFTVLPEPKNAECIAWNQSVTQWFAQHPEINTVLVSNHPGRVLTEPGQGLPAAQVAGIAAAWRALPATVTHIIVIRDIPYMHEDTLACVERARAMHRDADHACALARYGALHYDPDQIAAKRLHSPRVQVVDLTHFFCGWRLCYPVVGGALVYRDADHLTRVFATTLGPFLLRQVRRLMESWDRQGQAPIARAPTGAPTRMRAPTRMSAATRIGANISSGSPRTAAPPAPPAARASHPACFGAAAHDPAHPCENPTLRLAVKPTPKEAQILPNAPCTPIEPVLNVCGFGTSAGAASATIGLLGNSHAGHWRAALAVVARTLAWHGLSITRSSCPFMRATIDLPGPKRTACTRWRRGVVSWLDRHPEIGALFVSDQPTPPLVRRGTGVLAAEVGDYIAAWHELPATIGHIVVIRDNPYARGNTLACVERALSRREPPGERCAIPRAQALKPDPAVIAAQRLHSHRVQVVDLTRFFCDRRLCYPVIGGALVYKDADHLTRVFAASLGPYLLREVRRLMTSWRHGS